jgi:hypothetical protein
LWCAMRKPDAAQRGIEKLRALTRGLSHDWRLNRNALRASSCLHIGLLSTGCAPRRFFRDSRHVLKLMRITFVEKSLVEPNGIEPSTS